MYIFAYVDIYNYYITKPNYCEEAQKKLRINVKQK